MENGRSLEIYNRVMMSTSNKNKRKKSTRISGDFRVMGEFSSIKKKTKVTNEQQSQEKIIELTSFILY